MMDPADDVAYSLLRAFGLPHLATQYLELGIRAMGCALDEWSGEPEDREAAILRRAA
jgi:hypothetical protein